MVIIGGDLSRHVGKEADGYNGVHEGYGFGVRNTEGELVLEMGTTLDMVVWNIFFKKRDSRLITYKVLVLAVHKFTAYRSGTKTGSCRRYESNTQWKSCISTLNCSSDVKIKPYKVEKQSFIPKRRFENCKNHMLNRILLMISKILYRVIVEDHVEDLWKSLEDDLLSAADKRCR